MEKVGHEVLFIKGKPGENNRNATGTLFRMKDGRILFIWNEFFDDGWEDNHPCRIVCLTSHDEGESWGEKRVLMEHPKEAMNIAVLSMCYLSDGSIGMLYAYRKNNIVNGNPFGTITNYFVRSADEGRTWSEPVDCLPSRMENYFAGVDSLIRLQNGRLMYATARCSLYDENAMFGPSVVCFFYSDDDGYTWQKLPSEIGNTVKGDPEGWQEPRLYEFGDGRLWCYARSGLGWQFNAFSNDGGLTWSDMVPNYDFSAPCSPMVIKRTGAYTVSVFNPVPRHVDVPMGRHFWRTPLIFGVAAADEVKVKKYYYLEDDPRDAYCYPLVLPVEGGFLAAYEHSAGTPDCHTAIKVTKVLYNEICL